MISRPASEWENSSWSDGKNIKRRDESVEQLRIPLRRAVELNIGESQQVELCNGKKVTVKLLDIEETRDPLRSAIRVSRAKVAVDGKDIWLSSGNYNLPVTFGGVRIRQW